MEQYKKEFINFMIECQVLKFGSFTLKSGRQSPFFMNAGAYITGSQLFTLGKYYAQAIHDNFGDDFDVLFGPAYKGIPLAVATSIDALAVGVSFAFLKVDIIPAVCFIGVITFILSAIGVKVGNAVGCKYKSKAELVGGIVLIAMGTKILLEHLGFLG